MNAREAAPTQSNPALMPPGEPWWTVCAAPVPYVYRDHKLYREQGECGAEIQGGLAGLEAHSNTVHPEELALTYRDRPT